MDEYLSVITYGRYGPVFFGIFTNRVKKFKIFHLTVYLKKNYLKWGKL